MFIYALVSLIIIQLDYKKGVDTYDEIVDNYVITKTEKPVEKEEDIVEEIQPQIWPTFSGEMTEVVPTPEPEQRLEVDFTKLEKVNPDIMGWIFSPGTVINYPIVQGTDNDYYLNHLFNNKSSKTGSIFMDCINAVDFSDNNTVIYGHHMKNGSMFASIDKYKKQSYYNQHPYMYICTPEQDYRLELFSGYITEYDSDTYIIRFASKDEFQQYLDNVIAKSTFKSSIEVTTEDTIVTLSTCAYDFDNARYVVHGKLVKIYSAEEELYADEEEE